jgi:hypothetical protein
MATGPIDLALEMLEKANAELQSELLSAEDARVQLAKYAKAHKLAGFGMAEISRKVSDAAAVAKASGTSMAKAKSVVATGRAMKEAPELGEALRCGEVSLDQAAEIAVAAAAAPAAVPGLIDTARDEGFHVLRDAARKAKLEAEQHHGLGERQYAARSGRSYTDELGMMNIHLRLEPHVGAPLVNRAEALAQRRHREARKTLTNGSTPTNIGDVSANTDGSSPGGTVEPFECYLADAYAEILSGSGAKGSAKRPEMVILVSHEVAKRGWDDVREGEICKIPGVGPIAPKRAKEIAQDAFLTGISFDGKDLRNIKRWTRNIPIEVRLALELGDPPRFDGVRCKRCGNRFRPEFDHRRPHAAGGEASSENLDPLCPHCHVDKTEEDRKAGRFKPPDP